MILGHRPETKESIGLIGSGTMGQSSPKGDQLAAALQQRRKKLSNTMEAKAENIADVAADVRDQPIRK